MKPFTGLQDEVARYMPTTSPKHTPGPWNAWQPGFSDRQWAFGPHGKCPIGKTLGDNAPVEAANARLIASAPELLEALRELLGETDVPSHPTEGCSCPPCKAKAAIAKATGGAR